jgi:hypothetical protein
MEHLKTKATARSSNTHQTRHILPSQATGSSLNMVLLHKLLQLPQRRRDSLVACRTSSVENCQEAQVVQPSGPEPESLLVGSWHMNGMNMKSMSDADIITAASDLLLEGCSEAVLAVALLR